MDILESLNNRVLVADGAMGTMLYSKGIFLNRCFDEVNLSLPEMVKDIHRAYLHAGADIITTNTFGANAYRLGTQDLGDKVDDINIIGARLAREVADGRAFVGGSIGPIGSDDVSGIVTEQARALDRGCVDFFILESFGNIEELLLAIEAIRVFSNKVIVAQMALDRDSLVGGVAVTDISKALDSSRADIIGFNCSNGAMAMLKPVEEMLKVTKKPIIVQPNAGVPRREQGRQIYLCTPEYIASYAKSFIQMGVKVVGGCCGTTPDHIKEVRFFVRSISPTRGSVERVDYSQRAPDIKVIPIEERSRLAGKLSRGQFINTVEVTPPRGCDASSILKKVSMLKGEGIDAINIPDGPRASSRMSAMVMAQLIEYRVGIETIMHYCCRDRNLLGMQSDLLGGYAAGLKNVLIITGDPPKMGEFPDATPVFDVDSIGLTGMVNNFNHGLDMVAKASIGSPTGYFIGVGVNPVAVDLSIEVDRFYQKVDAGAEFAITQPIFDIEAFFRFLDRIKDISIPIIAGIWPLVSYRNAVFMNNEVPGVNVPEGIMEALKGATTKEAALNKGIKIANNTLNMLKDRIQGAQVSAPFGRVDYAIRVLGLD